MSHLLLNTTVESLISVTLFLSHTATTKSIWPTTQISLEMDYFPVKLPDKDIAYLTVITTCETQNRGPNSTVHGLMTHGN